MAHKEADQKPTPCLPTEMIIKIIDLALEDGISEEPENFVKTIYNFAATSRTTFRQVQDKLPRLLDRACDEDRAAWVVGAPDAPFRPLILDVSTIFPIRLRDRPMFMKLSVIYNQTPAEQWQRRRHDLTNQEARDKEEQRQAIISRPHLFIRHERYSYEEHRLSDYKRGESRRRLDKAEKRLELLKVAKRELDVASWCFEI